MIQQLLKRFHVERWLLVTLAAALLPGCMQAQQGLIRARQVLIINETPPGGAAIDLLIQDNSNTIVLQAGVNTGGQGNLVINSDAGPGFDSVAIIGQEGAVMIQLAEDSAGGVRLTAGIESDSGILEIYTGATQTVELSGSGGPSGDSTAGSLWMGDGAGNGGFDFYTASGVPTLDLYDNANVLALRMGGAPGGGLLDLYEDSGTVAVALNDGGNIQFSRAGTLRGFVGADATGFGLLQLEDTSSRLKLQLGVGTTASFLSLTETGAGTGNVDLRSIGTTPDLEIDFESGGDGYPAEDNANSWGITGNAWTDMVSKQFTLENTSDVTKLTISTDGGGDPFISLIESGAGASEEIRIEAKASDNGGDSIEIFNDAGASRISMGVAGSGLDAIIFLTDSEAETVVLKSDNDDAFTGLFVNGDRVVHARQTGPSSISCTPGGTYGATEQTCISDLVTAVNLLATALGTSGHGLVTSP